MSESRSILADLDIDPDNMFGANVELFQQQVLDNAERLIAVMDGKEVAGDRLCREMLRAAANAATPNEKIKAIRKQVMDLIFDHDTGETPLENDELAQLHAALLSVASSVESELSDRLISGGMQIIRSKKLASYLYQRLRVFHDKWRKAQALMNPDKQWKVLNGRPGNYKDGAGDFFVYLWNNEEYNFHFYIVNRLEKDPEFAGIKEAVKNVGDFHDWVHEHPECGVRIHTV